MRASARLISQDETAFTHFSNRTYTLTQKRSQDHFGVPAYVPVSAASFGVRLPRRLILLLADTTSRALPAVASHAIGCADPGPGGHSRGFSAC